MAIALLCEFPHATVWSIATNHLIAHRDQYLIQITGIACFAGRLATSSLSWALRAKILHTPTQCRVCDAALGQQDVGRCRPFDLSPTSSLIDTASQFACVSPAKGEMGSQAPPQKIRLVNRTYRPPSKAAAIGMQSNLNRKLLAWNPYPTDGNPGNKWGLQA